MAKRAYGQFCGLAHALELVGERWALLIVRDLLVGPRRFSDLRRGLPKIPTNILSARLKELEANGIATRRVLPRPASAVVYELTEYGAELEPVVLTLGRWGARSMLHPGPEDIVTTDSMIVALRSTFRPELAAGPPLSFVVHLGPVTIHAKIAEGELDAGAGPLDDPDLTIVTGPVLRDIMAGAVAPAEAVDGGMVQLTGDPALLDRFAALFAIPPAP
ncbi:winged helix-turn-helix transcriptional regulator [Phytomonospora endophytica]|uniref:DNA-binding HxlR family transcriptional regulator n=1 Tax=Phytomonospora endophytica TaxID=714109 RepID=A0A841FKS1_9ACTN|nr:helix-turn-helix domain-containing protein [Phytomonospora endophytica]MBB6034418.1 DNA-binding HxlR family transcriptional regulator [Phytomonospora endophytica]GIG66812.1 HxlR family transcriptional regulator [Phytomonospora endophytica]